MPAGDLRSLRGAARLEPVQMAASGLLDLRPAHTTYRRPNATLSAEKAPMLSFRRHCGLLMATLTLALFATACRFSQEPRNFHEPTTKKLTTSYDSTGITEERFKEEWTIGKGDWKVEGGKLIGSISGAALPDDEVPQAMVWFKGALPHEFRLSYKAKTTRRPGDIIAYMCGDGKQMSGYDVVLGGWNNERHRLSFYHVPGDIDRREGLDRKLGANMKQDKEYDVTIVRTASGIEVALDGETILEYPEDTKFLQDDNRYIALCTWDNDVEYWDVKIEGLRSADQPN